MSKVRPIPEGYHTVTPYLHVRHAARAIEFYQRAFGAELLLRLDMPDGTRVMHAEIRIGDSVVMLADESHEMGTPSPETLGGASGSLLIYVENVDAAFRRAIDAGATQLAAPADMFWGDRFCKVQDPFGQHWALATHIEDVAPEECERRAQQIFKQP
jgi:PhnB protein